MTLREEMIAILSADSTIGGRVVTDQTPKLALPYITVEPEIDEQSVLKGDARVLATDRMYQVDLWQTRTAESRALVDAIFDALDGVAVSDGMRMRVTGVQRLFDQDQNLIHHAYTVQTVVRRP